MTDKACAKCEYWRRNGIDGICFAGTPTPTILEEGKNYTVVWPRTNPDHFCAGFSPVDDADL